MKEGTVLQDFDLKREPEKEAGRSEKPSSLRSKLNPATKAKPRNGSKWKNLWEAVTFVDSHANKN